MLSPRRLPTLVLAAALASTLVACGEEGPEARSTEPPEKGACRLLTPEDVAQPSDDTPTVPCEDRHTAQTFAVGELPPSLHDLDADDPSLGAWVYGECSGAFTGFLSGDDGAGPTTRRGRPEHGGTAAT